MRIRILAGAVCAAAVAFPLVANAQELAGPTISVEANAGGTNPARDLVGLGTRIFDHIHGHGPSLYVPYSALALYEPRAAVVTTRKAKQAQ